MDNSKKVLVKLSIEMLIDVPQDANSGNIDFYMNDSSWCIGNFVGQLIAEHKIDGCFCNRATGKYIRDATPEDIEEYAGIIDAEKIYFDNTEIYNQLFERLKTELNKDNIDGEKCTEILEELEVWRQRI
jgi:hypothetical protein